MKKIALYIAIMILPFAAEFAMGQYSLDNTGGKINNAGTIRVKGGQVKALPDTIGGRVEFLQKNASSQQVIPNIVYNQLVLGNDAKKIVLDEKDKNNKVKPLVVRDSLIVNNGADFTTRWIGWSPEDIQAKGHLDNTAKYSGPKQIVMSGDTASQDLLGNGRFSNLKIDNPFGVNVIGGGFTIDSTLTLSRGELRNGANNNFQLADSIQIVRYADGSLSTTPNFEGRANVTYTGGGGTIATSGEIPNEADKLQDLRVENSGGIVLTKDVQVNKSLYVGSRINTEFDDVRRYVMTYTPALNPNFSESPYAEIEGTFRRTGLLFDSASMLFNNKFTWALFRNSINGNGVTAMNFRIKPRTFYALPEATDNKVKRTIEIWAEGDTQNDTVKFVPSVDVGYAWRYDGDSPALDENMGLERDALVLKRWSNNSWQDISSSSVPQLSADGKWLSANATNVDLLGKFVIGRNGGGEVTLMARVFLEGAYYEDSLMTTDLFRYNLLDSIPKDEYPYNLDPNRAKLKAKASVLDSIVDWIVLEFKSDTKPSKYACVLLRLDGRMLTPSGDSIINISNYGIDSGSYYIGVLHRNHLPVYSLGQYRIVPEYNGQMADFTKSRNVYGKEGSLRPLELMNGFLLYGMVAGDVNGDNTIDDTDYRLTWEHRDLQYKWSRYDVNMSGYVNTKDINFPWNNRGRSANIP